MACWRWSGRWWCYRFGCWERHFASH